MMIFRKILRKFAEIMRNFLEKILKICPKKMYTLNRYGGNRSTSASDSAGRRKGSRGRLTVRAHALRRPSSFLERQDDSDISTCGG